MLMVVVVGSVEAMGVVVAIDEDSNNDDDDDDGRDVIVMAVFVDDGCLMIYNCKVKRQDVLLCRR